MMKSFIFTLLFSFALLSSPKGRAASLELNGFYFTDAFVASSTTSGKFMAADFAFNLNLNKSGTFMVGWAYTMLTSAIEIGGTTSTFATADMGPRFSVFLDKQKVWGLGLTYNLISNATYDPSGTAVKWRGTSLKADFGYAPEIAENLHCGLRFNYYAGTWGEQLIGETTYSTIAYTRNWIYPSLYFRWEL